MIYLPLVELDVSRLGERLSTFLPCVSAVSHALHYSIITRGKTHLAVHRVIATS